ncbi:MAG: hypothetical protein EBU47_04635 [Betaproteobacteria bacterium]|nr:hypothetical protein [Betaproteobacteria bacterium]
MDGSPLNAAILGIAQRNNKQNFANRKINSYDENECSQAMLWMAFDKREMKSFGCRFASTQSGQGLDCLIVYHAEEAHGSAILEGLLCARSSVG